MTKSPEATGPVVVTKPARQITILDPAYPYRHAFTVDEDGVEIATPAAVFHVAQRTEAMQRSALNRARKINREVRERGRWLTRVEFDSTRKGRFVAARRDLESQRADVRRLERQWSKLARLSLRSATARTQTATPNPGLLERAAAKIRGLFGGAK